MALIARARAWTVQMLIACDQLLGCWLRGWAYVWGRGEAPSADETISSWVGRRSIAGAHWAQAAERLIDGLLGAGHCRRSIERQFMDQPKGIDAMTFRFEARESVGYFTPLQITDDANNPVDITGWTFKATFQRQAGSPDFTLNMAGSLSPTVQGFFVVAGPAGLLSINILPATLSGIADTSGKFLLFADLLGNPSGGARDWLADIVATIIQGPTA